MEKLHTKKFIIGFLLIMMIVVIIICKFLIWHEKIITKIDISDIKTITADEGFLMNIGECYYTPLESNDKLINILGWCALKGQPTNSLAMHILLMDNNSNEVYMLPTAIQKRTDVTDVLNSNDSNYINYDYSGYQVNTVCDDYFDFSNSTYKVGVLYKINGEEYVYFSGHNITLKEEIS